MAGKSRKKSSHGGRRVGAGRKREDALKLRAEILAECDKLICDNLPKLIANMLKLANGGYERVEEKWQPAEGESLEENPRMTLAERKVSVAEPDRYANVYLIDRLLGRPRQAVEVVEGDSDAPKRIVIPDVDDRPEPSPAG